MGTSGLGRAGSNHLGLAPNQTNQIGRAEIKSLLSDPKNDPSTQHAQAHSQQCGANRRHPQGSTCTSRCFRWPIVTYLLRCQ